MQYQKKLYKEYSSKIIVNQNSIILSVILDLWNGDVKGAINQFERVLKNGELKNEKFISLIFPTLIQFLIHRQVNFIYNLFTDDEYGREFVAYFQPIYYAVSILYRKDKNVSLIVPPEIKETVNSILKEIEERQEFYYANK